MTEMEELQDLLPVRLLEALYDGEILTLRAEREILISIRCPFVLTRNGNAELFPGGRSPTVMRLEGRKLLTATTEARNSYPDLILNFEDGVRLSARPPHAGEEMWYIDAPGVVFVSP